MHTIRDFIAHAMHLFAWLDHVCRVSDFLRVAATIYSACTRHAHAKVVGSSLDVSLGVSAVLPVDRIDRLESALVTPRGLAHVVMIGGCRFYQSRPIA